MFLYIAIFAVILCGIVYEQGLGRIYAPQTHGFRAFVVVFVIGLIAGLRDMMGGTDVYVYADIFENLAKTQEFSLGMFFSLGSEGRVMGAEPGWILYNRLVGLFTDNRYVFFFVTSLLCYLALFRHLRKFAPYFFFALLIIFCRQFLQSFIYVRQFMACMIVWFALDFAIKRRLIPFLAVVLVAMNIHVCGFLFVIVYPLIRWKMPGFVMLGGFAAALAMGLTPAFGAFLESFGTFVGNEKAVGYAEGTGGGAHLFYMAEGLLMAAAMLMARPAVYGRDVPAPIPGGNAAGSALARLKARLPRSAVDSSPRTVAMFNVMFLYICTSLTTLQSPGMMRLIWVFWIGPICMLPYVCEKIIAGGGRSFFKALIILYFIAAFWLFAVRFDSGEMLNYRTFLF